jgi:hypothetical protein
MLLFNYTQKNIFWKMKDTLLFCVYAYLFILWFLKYIWVNINITLYDDIMTSTFHFTICQWFIWIWLSLLKLLCLFLLIHLYTLARYCALSRALCYIMKIKIWMYEKSSYRVVFSFSHKKQGSVLVSSLLQNLRRIIN